MNYASNSGMLGEAQAARVSLEGSGTLAQAEIPKAVAYLHDLAARIGEQVCLLSDHADRLSGELCEANACSPSEHAPLRAGQLGSLDVAFERLDKLADRLRREVARNCVVA